MSQKHTSKKEQVLSGILIWGTIFAFVWMMINSVTVAGSIIIILNHEGYEKAEFTVDRIKYTNDSESGLLWGFYGYIRGKQERYFDHKLADGDALGHQGIRRKFPQGTAFSVFYNPDVTNTLFQQRSLNVISDTPDIMTKELETVKKWLHFGVLPFLVLFLFTKKLAFGKTTL